MYYVPCLSTFILVSSSSLRNARRVETGPESFGAFPTPPELPLNGNRGNGTAGRRGGPGTTRLRAPLLLISSSPPKCQQIRKMLYRSVQNVSESETQNSSTLCCENPSFCATFTVTCPSVFVVARATRHWDPARYPGADFVSNKNSTRQIQLEVHDWTSWIIQRTRVPQPKRDGETDKDQETPRPFPGTSQTRRQAISKEYTRSTDRH